MWRNEWLFVFFSSVRTNLAYLNVLILIFNSGDYIIITKIYNWFYKLILVAAEVTLKLIIIIPPLNRWLIFSSFFFFLKSYEN